MSNSKPNEFEKLSSQDPAIDQQPNIQSLWVNVSQRLPEGSLATVAPASVTHDDEDSTTSVYPDPGASAIQALPAARDRYAWGQIAASVILTALVVGAGARFVGFQQDDSASPAHSNQSAPLPDMPANSGDESFGAAPAEPNLGGSGAQGTPESQSHDALSPSAHGLGAEGAQSQSQAARMPSYGYFGEARPYYVAGNLPAGQKQAAAYGYDETSALGLDTFKKLQDIFDVPGDPQTSWGSYTVNSEDGAYLGLSGGGTGFFQYSRDYGELTDEPQEPEQAEEQAVNIMVSLGKEPEQYTIEVEEADYWVWDADDVVRTQTPEPAEPTQTDQTTEPNIAIAPAPEGNTVKIMRVTATPTVFESSMTSSAWAFEFHGATTLSASGSLADVVDLGQYDLVSPKQAVERMADPRFGSVNVLYPAEAPIVAYPANPQQDNSGNTPPKPARAPQAGAQLPWAVRAVTLKVADLAYADFHLGSSVYTLPVWKLKADDGATYEVLAVKDSQLNFKPTTSDM